MNVLLKKIVFSQGIFPKTKTYYTPSTWVEWATSNATGYPSGMMITFKSGTYASATKVTSLKPSTKYLLLFNVAANNLSTQKLYLSNTLTGSYVIAVSPGDPIGNVKLILTTQATITTNSLMLSSLVLGDEGLTIQINNIRIIELPIGSMLLQDATNMSADQLNTKYPFTHINKR